MNKTKVLMLLIASVIIIMSASSCTGYKEKPAENNLPEGGTAITTPAPAVPAVTQVPALPAGDFDYSLVIDGKDSYDISDLLYGLFLEDINFAVDGGLYAEKIKNRSFEYGKMAAGGACNGWSTLGEAAFEIIDGSKAQDALNTSNPQYARVSNPTADLSGIGNEGFLDGISLEKDAVYNFSAFFRAKDGYKGNITVRLQDSEENIYGEAVITGIKEEWWKYEARLTAEASIKEDLKLYVLIDKGTVDMDMISLFPEDTYKGRKNGIRKDLGEALEELTPKFLRFPGGCVVEGESLHNAYSWKDSIGNGTEFMINGEATYGDIAVRPLAENIWGNQNAKSEKPYYMTYGLGFYEYFLLCEDLGAVPVPVLNAGLSCLIQGTRSTGTPSEAEEIGTPEFDRYVQDALDLVEFCKGDAGTKWGAVRIAMGHEEPFELTYIGIGNEQWGNEYFNRYQAFKAAFDQAAADNPKLYGDIRLIVANGPAAGDRYAWNKIKLFGPDYAGLVDEHYYMAPAWFLTHTNRYDTYDRSSTQVFLGEYAAKSNNMEAALAEAAYMTGLERNGDIIRLASYAPLIGNGTSNQWTPDMLWYNNHTLWKSVNYYVQQLFSNYQSKKVLSSQLTGTSAAGAVLSGKVGVGTWMTSAVFDNIKVTNNATGEVLYREDFSSNIPADAEEIEGSWSVSDGLLKQSHAGNPLNTVTGDVLFLGDAAWTDYTLTLTATKLSGNEGFLIPIAVQDADNYFHWNIGGWGNTVSCLEQISAGVKSGQVTETVKDCAVETGKAYELKIVVSSDKIECYLDGKSLVNYAIPQTEAVYQVTGTDEEGNIIIKLVNVSGREQNILIQSKDLTIAEKKAEVTVLAAKAPGDMNNAAAPDKVSPKESTIDVSNEFIYIAPAYSVSIIRIPVSR